MYTYIYTIAYIQVRSYTYIYIISNKYLYNYNLHLAKFEVYN